MMMLAEDFIIFKPSLFSLAYKSLTFVQALAARDKPGCEVLDMGSFQQ